MTRLYVAACMAAVLVAQDATAQDYIMKLERPGNFTGVGNGATQTRFVSSKRAASASDECGEVDAVYTAVSDFGGITGFSGDSQCSTLNGVYGRFTCVTDGSEGWLFGFTEFFQDNCASNTQSDSSFLPEECALRVEDEGTALGNSTFVCDDVTSKAESTGSIVLASSRYGSANDCRNGIEAIGEENKVFFPAAEVGECRTLATTTNKAGDSDVPVYYKNACPESAGGRVTTLYSDVVCETMVSIGEINDANNAELLAVYRAVKTVGQCSLNDARDAYFNYDVCTSISWQTFQPTPKPTKVPTTDRPSMYPTKAPSQSPTTPTTLSPTNYPTSSTPTLAPTKTTTLAPTTFTKRPTKAPTEDSAAIAQGVAGDVLLAVAVATLALGAMA